MGCMATDRSERSDIRRGAMLVGVGGWLLIVSLGIGDLSYSSSWPLLLIIFGLIRTILPSEDRGRMSGVMLMAGGTIAWIATNRLWDFGWVSIWPLFVVFAGVEIVWSALRDPRGRRRRQESRGATGAARDGVNPSGAQSDGINPRKKRDD